MLKVLPFSNWRQQTSAGYYHFKEVCDGEINWAAPSEFGTYRLCEQRRFRRACASAQSRQNLRCSLIQVVNQEEPSDRKPDPWPLWMAGHAQLKFVMTECSKTQIRLTGPNYCYFFFIRHTQHFYLLDHCFSGHRLPSPPVRQHATFIWAPPSEFVSSSIASWQILTAHAQPFRGARDLAFCLKVPLDSQLVWASSEGSGETARMRRLAWTFAARIDDKYQIRLARPIYCPKYVNTYTGKSFCWHMGWGNDMLSNFS